MRSKMKGAAAARLGNDHTSGRFQVVRSQVDGRGTDLLSEADVFGTVTDHPGRGQIEAESDGCGPRHSWPWLAILARPGECLDDSIRVVWAMEEQVNMRVVAGEMLGYMPVYIADIVKAVKPAGDARLVGHDGDRHVRPG